MSQTTKARKSRQNLQWYACYLNALQCVVCTVTSVACVCMQSVPDFAASNCKIPDLSNLQEKSKTAFEPGSRIRHFVQVCPLPRPPPIPQVTCSKDSKSWIGSTARRCRGVDEEFFSFHPQSYGVWDYKWGYNRMQRWNQKMLSSQDCVQSRLSISRPSLITAACNQHYTCNQSFNQHAQCI